VQFAAALQTRPLSLLPVVKDLNAQSLRLHFPNCPYVPEAEREVQLAALQPCAVPQQAADADEVCFLLTFCSDHTKYFPWL
jgi:hypothetical protein